jgi:hypothetical protein
LNNGNVGSASNGAGRGGLFEANGTAGIANSGSGGGGGGGTNLAVGKTGGAGGSGICIIKYWA